jgi:hypothetical protein
MWWLFLACAVPCDVPAANTGCTENCPVILPNSCETPPNLPADPLTLALQYRSQVEPDDQYLVELVDVELSGDLVLAVGQGGLLVFDREDASLLGVGTGPGTSRFHRVEPIGNGFVAATHRDHGLWVFDISDPTAPAQVWRVETRGWEGLAAVDSRLYVATRNDGLVTFDITNPQAPVEVHRAPGLTAPWELVNTGDGWLYAADNVEGLVPISIANPSAPVVGAPVAVDGALLHISGDENYLYGSNGGLGVIVFERSDPAGPTPIARAETGGSVLMAAVDAGVLWTVDHEAVMAFNVEDPSTPTPLGREVVEQYALAVDADEGVGWVGDWGLLEAWSLASGGGELDAPDDLISLPLAGGSTELVLSNRGGQALTLSGAQVANPDVEIVASSATIPPGESSILTLTWAGGELETTLCVAANDADSPVQTFRVHAGRDEAPVGTVPPDFSLTDLDGTTHRLSEALGHPVLIAYFATW